MTETPTASRHYDQIADKVGNWHEQTEALAERYLNNASAFGKAMTEVADELGQEYAEDFCARLSIMRDENGWPDPSLLAELKELNPKGMETFLDRFESISELQREAYQQAADQLTAKIIAGRQPGIETEQQPQQKFARVRELARSILHGFDSIRL